MRSISHGVTSMIGKQQWHNHQRDPWAWVAWMSLIVLVWTTWGWRQHHDQIVQHLQPTLQSLEQQYWTTNQQLKRIVDQKRRLENDIEQMNRNNRRYESIIQQHEGRIVSHSNTRDVNIDTPHDEQAERLEQMYLNRIDDVQDQITRWNEKRMFQNFGNRFPTFKFHTRARMISHDHDGNNTATNNSNDKNSQYHDVQLQMRFNLKPYPVEIALLYQMIKTQRWEGFALEFVVQEKDNRSQTSIALSSSPVFQLLRIDLPTYLPNWPVHHHIRIVQEESIANNWFVVAEPFVHNNNSPMGEEPSKREPLQEASPQSLAHILKGYDVLNDFYHEYCNRRYQMNDDATTKTSTATTVRLRLEIVAAERVVPRRIQHVAPPREEL